MPILIDDYNRIIAGHGRLEAAQLLGLETVPTIRLEDLTEDQVRALALADNRLAELATWDSGLLLEEIRLVLDTEIDIGATGFDAAFIDQLMIDPEEEPEPDEAPKDPDEDDVPISQLGDVWVTGRHRIICGDALCDETYNALMRGERAQMLITDPPYNLKIQGHVSGLGAIKHREFVQASGELSKEEFIDFLETFIRCATSHSLDGAIHYIFMDWRHLYELLTAGQAAYSELKNLVVWNKSNAGMGAFYRSKHELIAVFKHGRAAHVNNFELGQHGRYRTNVWDYRGVNAFGVNRLDELQMHPTVKPVALIADAIRDCSTHDSIILDCFAGSGTTLIACEDTGRLARCIELDRLYVDVAVKRWQRHTNQQAIHAESGRTFDSLQEERSGEVHHD